LNTNLVEQEILKLKKRESKNGTNFLVWAPSSLFYAMEKRKSTNFFLNLGVERSEKTGNNF